MRVIFIVLMAGLVGCSIPPFTPTERNDYIELTIIIDNDLSRLGRDYGKWKVSETHARDGNNCVLWLPEIKSLDDENFRAWGKGLAHCWGGDYHKGITDIY